MSHLTNLLVLALCASLSLACSFDSNLSFNKCGFTDCFIGAECASNKCVGDLLSRGYCYPEGW